MMSRIIDRHINEALSVAGRQPAALCTDAEFLRRASLDLVGVVPTVYEVREFLADPRADKRTQCVDRLLASPRHATHLAHVWSRIILPDSSDPQLINQATQLHQWLRNQFVSQTRYDRLVAAFLSATGEEGAGPAVFYRALDFKPEKLAAATSRVFLGLQIQCAECHDHPFDHWTQRDFWGYAAFFAQLQRSSMQPDRIQLVDLPDGDVRIPDSDDVVLPKYPTATTPVEIRRGTRRRQLSIWMASRDNPYLAPAAVNRVWAQMFGRGLVHPVDDLGPNNTASHPELMNELTTYFLQQHFNLSQLYRAIANSQTYQRTSRHRGNMADGDPVGFQRMPIRRLTADQFVDSLARSLGIELGEGRRPLVAMVQSNSSDLTHYDLGIQQALQMMNGRFIAKETSDTGGRLLSSIDAPFFNDDQRVEVLFLATLSRHPTDAERQRISASMQIDGAVDLRGLLWALLNSAEYQFNH